MLRLKMEVFYPYPPQGIWQTARLGTLADGSATGGFFRDRQPIDW